MKKIKTTGDLRLFLVDQLYSLRKKKVNIAAAKASLSTVREICNLAKLDLAVARFAIEHKGKSVPTASLALR